MPYFVVDALGEVVLCTKRRIQVGGDFITWALDWGMLYPESRGKRFFEMVARTGRVVPDNESTITS